MHDRGVILLPIAREPTQPDQQRDRRFPQGSIHLIKQPAEIVGEAILLLCRRRLRRGRDGGSRKRARCEIAVPDVVDGQDAGRDRARSPPRCTRALSTIPMMSLCFFRMTPITFPQLGPFKIA